MSGDGSTGSSSGACGSLDFPTLKEAATAILTPEELQNMRRNLTEEKIAHAKYLREHPEIDTLMRRAMRMLLMERPKDPVSLLLEFFAHRDLKAELETSDEEAEHRVLRAQQLQGMTRAWPP
ncbi:hypothetical protein DQ04_00011380 [Trypanosoma grayi]|uniref:hypothetical protein n=1 Tax=Trypanosoma grayi TaxID=71804 RepID=UPI0004F45948|nr:hypothetical protein DQ04_00011380 [Trypanosoma grayi]KEG15671.1 hypothetical protein DQ04_00011380 [Trypanosoma grayi]